MRRRRRKRKNTSSSEGSWLTVYSDMVTLLLCFFILLFSMSVLDNSKFNSMLNSFIANPSVINGTGSNIIGKSSGENDSLIEMPYKDTRNLPNKEDLIMTEIYNELQTLVVSNKLEDSVIIEKKDPWIAIRFKDNILFDSGKADLKQESKEILTEINNLLLKYKKRIKIEGHTDNVPMNTAKYPSNWELSVGRAISVLKYLLHEVPSKERLSPELLEISGYGEYKPIVPNTSKENKAKNRRIEIIIYKE